LFLVGMMGAGKSTVGKTLAYRLGKTFIDSDHEIEARTGVKIPVIFELEGESGFRAREHEVIDAVSQRSNIVLATGGGSVLDRRTREHLRTRGFTIYISSSVNELWLRTHNDRNRPLLQTHDPRARLAELLQLRDPLYRDVADMVVETGRPSVGKLVGQIVEELMTRPDCKSLFASLPQAEAAVKDG
jgi:shikimate kinase